MNIFLPYEYDIIKSVECLDDLRLNKQILEVHQLLQNAIKEEHGEEIKGYKNHPVYVFYKNNIPFLVYYGLCCGIEYCERFNKTHFLYTSIVGFCELFLDKVQFLTYKEPKYISYYMEGSIKDPTHIRTTENVSELFQAKLCKKWDSDKAKGRPPRWTNRDVPEFYQQWLKESRDD